MDTSISRHFSPTTLEKFATYERLLREWNQKMNLVQENTLSNFLERHIIDSAQVIPIIEQYAGQDIPWDEPSSLKSSVSILDIGTGAGFPGMILAMCGFEKVTLCESNQKKCLFLKELARQTDTKVTIMNTRVEELEDHYNIIVSRACTSLNDLCKMVTDVSRETSPLCLFHKGRSWKEEIEEAQRYWDFEHQVVSSITSLGGVIVVIKDVKKK